MPELMQEEKNLCSCGKEPKIFSYLEEETQQFVVLNCKLKADITEFDLKKFFNQVYSANLDKGYEEIFQEKYTSMNLIECLKSILKEKNVINLKGLYDILSKNANTNWEPFKKVMKEFQKRFDVSGMSYSFKEFQEMEKYVQKNAWFNPENSNFNKELIALKYNTYMLNSNHFLSKQPIPSKNVKRKERKITKYPKAS